MLQMAKKIARILAILARAVPFAARRALIRALLLVESRISSPESALKRLFGLADDLDRLISERATAYGHGVNPKHRLTGYHAFFVSNIAPGARVLDLGCGIGELARSIAQQVPGCVVVGVDSNPAILAQARSRPTPGNLTFAEGDATQGLPAGPWDTVVLSNVLEHIDRRIDFLTCLVEKTNPATLLIRVPQFERHWHMPLRQELGVDFRSDPTHFIEHTVPEFEHELSQAKLRVTKRVSVWGEIWAIAEPVR